MLTKSGSILYLDFILVLLLWSTCTIFKRTPIHPTWHKVLPQEPRKPTVLVWKKQLTVWSVRLRYWNQKHNSKLSDWLRCICHTLCLSFSDFTVLLSLGSCSTFKELLIFMVFWGSNKNSENARFCFASENF